jgi:hypothetical protein
MQDTTGIDPKIEVRLDETGRRAFLKGTAASAVVIVGSGDYVKPALRFLGVARGQAIVSPIPEREGEKKEEKEEKEKDEKDAGRHSSSFWMGKSGEDADDWWSESNDAGWGQHGGRGTNPFQHATQFSPFFTAHGQLQNMTMWAVLDGSGGSSARKAARELVAAYLNASFDRRYPFTQATLKAMWTTAVNHGDRALDALRSLLRATNSN